MLSTAILGRGAEDSRAFTPRLLKSMILLAGYRA